MTDKPTPTVSLPMTPQAPHSLQPCSYFPREVTFFCAAQVRDLEGSTIAPRPSVSIRDWFQDPQDLKIPQSSPLYKVVLYLRITSSYIL